VQPPGLFLALQKTTGNNSGCKQNEYRYFVKVAKTMSRNGTPGLWLQAVPGLYLRFEPIGRQQFVPATRRAKEKSED
jgi:hypothetical protein